MDMGYGDPKGYDSMYMSEQAQRENTEIARLCRQLGIGSRQVVDIGCGTGLLLELAAIGRGKYTGVDIDQRMIGYARKKHRGYVFVQAEAGKWIADREPRQWRGVDIVSLFAIDHVSSEAVSHAVSSTGGALLFVCYHRPWAEGSSSIWAGKREAFTVECMEGSCAVRMVLCRAGLKAVPLCGQEYYTVFYREGQAI